MEGKINGTLRITWDSGVKLQSDLSLARVSAQPLVAAFTKAISITGKLELEYEGELKGGDAVVWIITT